MASNPPIIKPTYQIVGPAIDAIAADMPAALPNLYSGTFAAVPAIIEAHTDLALARVADEVQSARLRFATGASLRELCASEFNLSVAPAQQSAYATVVLGRGNGALPAGVIKAGSLFAQQANPNAYPVPTQAATYQSLQTIYMPRSATLAVVPCVAVTPGAAANVPTFTNTTKAITTLSGSFVYPSVVFGFEVTITVADPSKVTAGMTFEIPGYGYFYVVTLIGGIVIAPLVAQSGQESPFGGIPGQVVPSGLGLYPGNQSIQATTPLFDSNLSVIDSDASGGAPGIDDPGLVAAARANAIGQYGPTDGALVAGVLSQQSVAYYAFFRATGGIPYAQAYIADPAWASSGLGLGSGTSWVDSVAASVAANQQGFGCRIRWGQVVNLLTAASCDIYLKSTEALAYTQAIDQNVRAAIRAYFDERQDWYLFRLKGLASAIRNSDPNIQQVQNVVVSDAVTGSSLPEVTVPGVGTWIPTLQHYYIGTADSDNTVSARYFPPA